MNIFRVNTNLKVAADTDIWPKTNTKMPYREVDTIMYVNPFIAFV